MFHFACGWTNVDCRMNQDSHSYQIGNFPWHQLSFIMWPYLHQKVATVFELLQTAEKEEMFCLHSETLMIPEIDMGLGERQITIVNATSKAGDVVQVRGLGMEELGTSKVLCCKGTLPSNNVIVEAKCELQPALVGMPNALIKATLRIWNYTVCLCDFWKVEDFWKLVLFEKY